MAPPFLWERATSCAERESFLGQNRSPTWKGQQTKILVSSSCDLTKPHSHSYRSRVQLLIETDGMRLATQMPPFNSTTQWQWCCRFKRNSHLESSENVLTKTLFDTERETRSLTCMCDSSFMLARQERAKTCARAALESPNLFIQSHNQYIRTITPLHIPLIIMAMHDSWLVSLILNYYSDALVTWLGVIARAWWCQMAIKFLSVSLTRLPWVRMPKDSSEMSSYLLLWLILFHRHTLFLQVLLNKTRLGVYELQSNTSLRWNFFDSGTNLA